MTASNDLSRCAGNGDPQCVDCLRALPGNVYSSNIAPAPPGSECPHRIIPLTVACREVQGRGD